MVEIRPVRKDDFPQIKALIKTAWFPDLATDSAVLNTLTFLYLNPVMHDSTFGRVAEDGGRVVGVVFCSHQNEAPCFRALQSDGVTESLSLLRTDKQNLQWVLQYLKQWEKAYQHLMVGRGMRYQATVELLCVDPEWQRRYVGTALLSQVMSYCTDLPTTYLCAFADTPQQLAFYTENGFTKSVEAKILNEHKDHSFTHDAVYLCENVVIPVKQGG